MGPYRLGQAKGPHPWLKLVGILFYRRALYPRTGAAQEPAPNYPLVCLTTRNILLACVPCLNPAP